MSAFLGFRGHSPGARSLRRDSGGRTDVGTDPVASEARLQQANPHPARFRDHVASTWGHGANIERHAQSPAYGPRSLFWDTKGVRLCPLRRAGSPGHEREAEPLGAREPLRCVFMGIPQAERSVATSGESEPSASRERQLSPAQALGHETSQGSGASPERKPRGQCRPGSPSWDYCPEGGSSRNHTTWKAGHGSSGTRSARLSFLALGSWPPGAPEVALLSLFM